MVTAYPRPFLLSFKNSKVSNVTTLWAPRDSMTLVLCCSMALASKRPLGFYGIMSLPLCFYPFLFPYPYFAKSINYLIMLMAVTFITLFHFTDIHYHFIILSMIMCQCHLFDPSWSNRFPCDVKHHSSIYLSYILRELYWSFWNYYSCRSMSLQAHLGWYSTLPPCVSEFKLTEIIFYYHHCICLKSPEMLRCKMILYGTLTNDPAGPAESWLSYKL